MTETNSRIPLAERMRPKKLTDVIGQEDIIGDGKILTEIARKQEPVNIIFWGPPGTGKTTMARIIAHEFNADFIEISAVTSGKKDVEKVVERAKQNWNLQTRTVLFVDEIHRFNKAQQDAFLPHVESGLITLIGATTRAGQMTTPLRDRFGVILKLELYTPEELATIVRRSADILSLPLSPDGAIEIASRSRGTPRIVNRLLKRVRDYAEVRGDGIITREIADMALQALEIDELGLDDRAADMDDGFVREDRSAFGNGPHVAGELEVPEVVEEVVREAAGLQVRKVFLGEVQVVQVVHHLLETGRDDVAAVVRDMTVEEVEVTDGVLQPVMEIATTHGQLVEVGEHGDVEVFVEVIALPVVTQRERLLQCFSKSIIAPRKKPFND